MQKYEFIFQGLETESPFIVGHFVGQTSFKYVVLSLILTMNIDSLQSEGQLGPLLLRKEVVAFSVHACLEQSK
jgi:hypothetical protein